jgi:hypothetical protein
LRAIDELLTTAAADRARSVGDAMRRRRHARRLRRAGDARAGRDETKRQHFFDASEAITVAPEFAAVRLNEKVEAGAVGQPIWLLARGGVFGAAFLMPKAESGMWVSLARVRVFEGSDTHNHTRNATRNNVPPWSPMSRPRATS